MTLISTAIFGAGAVGYAIAYELSRHKKLAQSTEEIVLFERNAKVAGENQSSRTSGVIHAGIYYSKKVSPKKARHCVAGNKMLYEFCPEYDVPHKKVGKLVVARNLREKEYLDDVVATARDNGVPDIQEIDGDRVKLMEPNVTALCALYFPTSGIIDATAYVRTLHRLAQNKGVVVMNGYTVVDVKPRGKFMEVTTKCGENIETFETKIIINAAGLYSDEIARMINPESPYEIVPTRGESAKFYKSRREDITMNGLNVYPAPCGYYNDTGEVAQVSFQEFQKLLFEKKITKTTGVHLTPSFDLVHGEYVIGNTVTIGPAKSVGYGKENYSEGLRGPEYFHGQVHHYFSGLRVDDIELHQAGIMAVLKGHSDWVIERDRRYPNCINTIGIDTPGLTGSLSIAKDVLELWKDYI